MACFCDTKLQQQAVFFTPLQGTAYIHGIKHATGNFIFIMDADLSHHVSVLFFFFFFYLQKHTPWVVLMSRFVSFSMDFPIFVLSA